MLENNDLETSMFFFEKKNQKTFTRLGRACGGAVRKSPMDKSLFASFSSEKEDPSSFTQGTSS
jgi:hypothetical protein